MSYIDGSILFFEIHKWHLRTSSSVSFSVSRKHKALQYPQHMCFPECSSPLLWAEDWNSNFLWWCSWIPGVHRTSFHALTPWDRGRIFSICASRFDVWINWPTRRISAKKSFENNGQSWNPKSLTTMQCHASRGTSQVLGWGGWHCLVSRSPHL